jgi:hypothetical protein
MAVTETLSPKQILAAQHLALGESQGKAAQIAKVTRVTVNRWLRLPAFKVKVEEFRKELEQIEGNVFTEVAKEVGEKAKENALKTITPDELKAKLTEMFNDETLAPAHRIKIAQTLGKWCGLETPKPVSSSGDDSFPIKIDENETENLKDLSDDELMKRYLETLAES